MDEIKTISLSYTFPFSVIQDAIDCGGLRDRRHFPWWHSLVWGDQQRCVLVVLSWHADGFFEDDAFPLRTEIGPKEWGVAMSKMDGGAMMRIAHQDSDAGDADTLLQFAVFGELLFG